MFHARSRSSGSTATTCQRRPSARRNCPARQRRHRRLARAAAARRRTAGAAGGRAGAAAARFAPAAGPRDAMTGGRRPSGSCRIPMACSNSDGARAQRGPGRPRGRPGRAARRAETGPRAEPSTVLVGGEAGRRQDPAGGGVLPRAATGGRRRVLTGQCLELGEEGLPFAPFAAALRDAAARRRARRSSPATSAEFARLLPELGPAARAVGRRPPRGYLFEPGRRAVRPARRASARWCWSSRTCTGPTGPPAT